MYVQYRVMLVVCNKLLLTLIWLFLRLPEFGNMAELPSKTQQKFDADHQRHPVQLYSVEGKKWCQVARGLRRSCHSWLVFPETLTARLSWINLVRVRELGPR